MKVKENVGEIQVSKQYDRFKTIKGNRQINIRHKNQLREALELNSSLLEKNPILVNEKYEIIDGQHRFNAAKELDLPIYYLKMNGLSLKDVQLLNAGRKNWSPIDYAKSYSELGKIDYQLYIDFAEAYPLNHDVLRYVLSMGKCTGPKFREGKFQLWHVKEATEFFMALEQFKEKVPWWMTRAFALAFYRIFKTEGYNHQRMLHKLNKIDTSTLSRFNTIPEVLRQLELIYNSGVGRDQKVRLY